MEEEIPYREFRVWLRSVPGMYAQYDGKIDVIAVSSEEAKEEAFRKLKCGAFPDRSNDMWRMEKVEEL